MSIKRNLIFNAIANIGSKGVRIIEQLLLVPFFITAWGAAYYGEWLTLSIIPNVLAFSDLGFGSAASNSFVLSYSEGNIKRASNIYNTAFIVISFSVLLGILLSFGVMGFANATGLLTKSLINPTDAVLSLSFMMGSRLVSFYSQLYGALYRAKHRAALSINLLSLDNILRIVTGMWVLMAGYGIVVYSLSQMIMSAIFNVFYAMYGLYIIGRLPSSRYVKEEAKDIVKKGLGFMMTFVWQSIYLQGSTLVVRIALGSEAVAVFNTVRTVCRSVNQMYNVVNGAIFPELQCEIGSGNWIKAQKIFIYAIRLVVWLAIIGVLFLCIFGMPLYSWWTRNELAVPSSVWYVFMIGISFNAIWWTASCVFNVINQPYRLAVYGLISACVSTAVSYVLAYQLGLMGAAIGYVVMDVLMAFLIYPMGCKIMRLDVKSVLVKMR